MELHNIRPAKGATKSSKRIGRGQGSGHGGTSTKGHKGAQSRAGYSSKTGFEGGQMPLQRRVPKFGFRPINRIEYVAVNLDMLQKISEDKGIKTFDMDVFVSNGLVSKNGKIKVLARGEVKSSLDVKAHKFSDKAKTAIESAGGKVETI
ncbi:MAG: 50S ribosomal protein L15 [Bacteroidetes bacterium]|nr:50S ribosomal protein L15 [Bacteroidota bacterium]